MNRALFLLAAWSLLFQGKTEASSFRFEAGAIRDGATPWIEEAVLSPLLDPPVAWTETQDDDTLTVRVSQDGALHWTTRKDLPDRRSLRWTETLEQTGPRPSGVKFQGWEFRGRLGPVPVAGVTVSNMRVTRFSPEPRRWKIGLFVPYLILDAPEIKSALHVSLPDWIDRTGWTALEGPEGKDLHLRISPPHSPSGPSDSTIDRLELRFGAFPIKPPSSAARDVLRVNSHSAAGLVTRDNLEAMGFPLPPATPRTGHVFILSLDQKAADWIPLLAAAGTSDIVLRSPDFADISQGVSWNGSYEASPPGLNELIKEIHRRGMRALWWFSIKGVLREGTLRNGGHGSPLLGEHPEWFSEKTYWKNGMYRWARIMNPDWRAWILAKMRSDLARHPLDGFALDEPYIYGLASSDTGPTYSRTVYDLLGQIRDTLRQARPDNGRLIANYWFPGAGEGDFFDAMMTERSELMWLNDVTAGRHGAGHTLAAPRNTFDLILHQLAFNFGGAGQSIGWSHPEWFFSLPGSGLTRENVAELLHVSGASISTSCISFPSGVRQVESAEKNGRFLLLINLSDKDLPLTFVQPASFRLRSWKLTDSALFSNSGKKTFDATTLKNGALALEKLSLPGKNIALFHFVPR